MGQERDAFRDDAVRSAVGTLDILAETVYCPSILSWKSANESHSVCWLLRFGNPFAQLRNDM
jgi:hypothetical protein